MYKINAMVDRIYGPSDLAGYVNIWEMVTLSNDTLSNDLQVVYRQG